MGVSWFPYLSSISRSGRCPSNSTVSVHWRRSDTPLLCTGSQNFTDFVWTSLCLLTTWGKKSFSGSGWRWMCRQSLPGRREWLLQTPLWGRRQSPCLRNMEWKQALTPLQPFCHSDAPPLWGRATNQSVLSHKQWTQPSTSDVLDQLDVMKDERSPESIWKNIKPTAERRWHSCVLAVILGGTSPRSLSSGGKTPSHGYHRLQGDSVCIAPQLVTRWN